MSVDLSIDRENAFLLYATFCGDVVRTAHALNVPAQAVLAMAESEGWTGKLKPILDLSKSQKPGDLDRAVNRALNFVQCHKMRCLLERVLRELTDKSDAQLAEMTVEKTETKGGDKRTKLCTRGFADLTSALEKCHAMSYLALSDTAQDRSKRKEAGGDESVPDLHAAIAKAMAEAGASNTPRARLFDAQLAQGAELAAAAIKPVHPNDNDEH